MSDLINNLHKIYRNDPYIQSIFNSADLVLEDISIRITDFEKEYWFDTLSLLGIELLEKQLNFKSNPLVSLEDRRSQLEARWKMGGKSDIELLQSLADTWRYGAVAIKFSGSIIEVEFVSILGIPSDVDGLKHALETAKPAHLAITYKFKYRVWDEIKAKTWDELLTKTWLDLREGVI